MRILIFAFFLGIIPSGLIGAPFPEVDRAISSPLEGLIRPGHLFQLVGVDGAWIRAPRDGSRTAVEKYVKYNLDETVDEIVEELLELHEVLKDEDIGEIVYHLLANESKDILRSQRWEKILEFFKELQIKIFEQYKKFAEWLRSIWGSGTDELKERYGTIKAIALEFIEHGKNVGAEVAREALEFLRPYKEDLGDLWQKVVDTATEAIAEN